MNPCIINPLLQKAISYMSYKIMETTKDRIVSCTLLDRKINEEVTQQIKFKNKSTDENQNNNHNKSNTKDNKSGKKKS